MVLEHIDANKNNAIETEELLHAINRGFFDKTENIQAIQKQLEQAKSTLTQTLESILQQLYTQLIKKASRTQNETKIITLYKTLLGGTHNSYTNNPPINTLLTQATRQKATLPNLIDIEYNHYKEFEKITQRATMQHTKEYTTFKNNLYKRYTDKSPQEQQEYIKYETIMRSIEKYYKELQAQDNQLLQQYGFANTTHGEIDGKQALLACQELFTFLKNTQYEQYDKDALLINMYNKDIEKTLKNNGYLGNNLFEKHSIAYKIFSKEIETLAKETKYEESIQYLSKHSEPANEDAVETYLGHIENTIQYSESYTQLTKRYGPKMLAGYTRTMQQITQIQQKYPGFSDAMQTMSLYNQKMEQKKKTLQLDDETIGRYIQYTTQAATIYTLQDRCNNLSNKLQQEVSGKTDNTFIFPAIKESIRKQQEQQRQKDTKRTILKTMNPTAYYTASTLAGARNGLVDATISVGTGLGVLITSIYRDENETIANSDRAKKRNDFFKMGLSTAQQEPPVKDGKWNLSFDNGSVQLGSQVVNMLVLLSGAGMVGRGTMVAGSKIGLKIGERVGRKIGLFAWASMQGLPNTFQEYRGQGIDTATARKYALGVTLLTSSLEMMAPNDIFFGNPSIKTILKQLGGKEGAKVIAKIVVKNMSKETGEEVAQESAQLAVERLINKTINESHNTNLETSLTRADFGTTALLTALTTGIVSSKGVRQTSQNTASHTKTIQRIISDTQRQQEYMDKLNDIIHGKIDIGIQSEQATIVLDEIHSALRSKTNIDEQTNTQTTEISNTPINRSTIKSQIDNNYSSKKTELENKINNETDPNTQKALTKKSKSLETAYQKINKIINGEATMEEYVGIRSYAKELGLKNIESDMLPLTRKIIENHLQKTHPGKEITQSDIDAYINDQININQILTEIFGENIAKEQAYKGPDAQAQIMEILQSLPTESSDLLSIQNRQTLQAYALGHIQALQAGFDLSQEQIFVIVQKNIHKAIFQNIADKGLLSGSDHGIVHIIEGNIFASRKMIDQIQGLDAKTNAKLKAMVGQIIIDHDIGYNMQAFEKMIKKVQTTGNYDKKMFFEATKDHPLFSRLFLEANADYYRQLFGKENFDIMKVAMLDHSDVYSTDFSHEIEGLNQGDPQATGSALQKLISLVDCMGVTHVDKLHALFKYPNMIHLLGKFQFIQENIASNSPQGIGLNKQIKQQMHDEIKAMEAESIIDKNTAEQYHNAIEKGMDISDNNGDNPNGFGLKFNFSSFIYSPGGYTLENNSNGNMDIGLDQDMFNIINELYGSSVAMNNLKKLIGDYGVIETITIGTTTIQIHDEKSIRVGDQIIQTKANQTVQDAMMETLTQQIQQASYASTIDIKTTAKDGSLIHFTININQTTQENNSIYENLLITTNKNNRLNKPIQEIIQRLDQNEQNKQTQEAIEDSIMKIKESYPEIGDAIKDIIQDNSITDKKTAIQTILSKNIAMIYDNNTSIDNTQNINNQDTPTNMPIFTDNERVSIQEESDQEYQEIRKNIETNKNNPDGVATIMNTIKQKIQIIEGKWNTLTKTEKSPIIKTKEYLKMLHHIHLIHHLTSSIKTIVYDGKNWHNNITQKQWYSLVGNTVNITTQILLGIAVLGPHILEALHTLHGDGGLGGIAAMRGSTTSLKIVSDHIEKMAHAFKESMSQTQAKIDIKKQLQGLETAEIQSENTSAMIENYKTRTKGLTDGMSLENNIHIAQAFYDMDGYTLTIDQNTSLQDIYNHIIQQREDNNGDPLQHKANIHILTNMINPNKEMRNIATNIQYSIIKNKNNIEKEEHRETNVGGEQREHTTHALHIGH